MKGLIFCLFLFLVFYPFISFAYSTKTHAYLTEVMVDFYNKNFKDIKIDDNLKKYLIDGSIREDDPPRWLNHFYDPVYKRGLTYDTAIDPINFGNWLSSKEWVKNEKEQTSLLYKAKKYLSSLLGVLGRQELGEEKTNFTWQEALRLYSEGEKERAMFALGHVLHLIEDLGVPDHTRNDPHLDGSPFENWTARFTILSPDKNLDKAISGKSPIVLNNLEDYFDGLAVYSNNNFFSKDTVGVQSGYTLPQPDLTNLMIKNSKYYILAQDYKGNEYPLFVKNSLLGSILGIKGVSFSIDDDLVMAAYWKLLSPEVVRYGAGVIDLFVKKAVAMQEEKKSQSAASLISSASDFGDKKNQEVLNEDKETVLPVIYTETLVVKSGDSLVLKGKNFVPLSPVNIFVENSSSFKKSFNVLSNSDGSFSFVLEISPSFSEGVYSFYARDTKTNTTSNKGTFSVLKQIVLVENTTTSVSSNLKSSSERKGNFSTSSPEIKNEEDILKNKCLFDETQIPSHYPVIISEVSWMGGSEIYGLSSSDEWIELKNLTSAEINLNGFELLSKKGNIKVVFPANAKIEPYGYFLLERTDDNSVPNVTADFLYTEGLSNSDDGLELFNPQCNLLDKVIADSDWPAGDSSQRRSMERDSTLRWYTSGSFNGKVFGTPRFANGSAYIYESSRSSSYSFSSGGGGSNTNVANNTPFNSGVTSSLIINEIMYDHPGKDDGYEWVEIKNTGNADVDISTLKFVENETAHNLQQVLGSTALKAGELAVIANGTSTFLAQFPHFSGNLFYSSFSLSNSGENIALRFSTDVFGEIEYNSGWGANGDGNSLQFISGEWKWSLPTPGSNNILNQIESESEDVLVDGEAANNLVISEVRLGGEDAGDEFIEVYNPKDEEISLEGFSIQYVSGSVASFSSSTIYKKNFESGDVIKPHKFFLLGRGLDENDEDGYKGEKTPDLVYRSFSLSEDDEGGAIFLVSTTTLISSFDDEEIISAVFYGRGDVFLNKKGAPLPPPGGSLVRKAFLSGKCISSLEGDEGEFLPKVCITGLSQTEFMVSNVSKPQNTQSLGEPRSAPSPLTAEMGKSSVAFYNYEKAGVEFKWKPSLDAENSPSGIVYEISALSEAGEEFLIGTTTLLNFFYNLPKIGEEYKFILRAYDRDGMTSLPLELEVETPFLNALPIIFSNGVLGGVSAGSHYSDNWYELGRGFSGVLKSLTLRGYVEYIKAPVNIILEEFEDENYQHKLNSFLLASGDIFETYVKNVKIDNLNVELNPYSFYRLRTEDSWQNKSVILLGDEEKGRAMSNSFVYGVGRVENYYPFYPFILMEGEKGPYVDVSVLQKPTKPTLTLVQFDKTGLSLNLSWTASTDKDSLDDNVKYQINYTPFTEFNNNEWIDLEKNTSFSVPLVFPNKYKIGIRAIDDDRLYSDVEILEWEFPQNFSPYVLSNSYNSVSQEFVLDENIILKKITVYTSSFSTISRYPDTNQCFLKLEDITSGNPIIVAEADSPRSGYDCQGTPSFNFENSLPHIFAGNHYRWTYFIKMAYDDLPKATVRFYGRDEYIVGGQFSGVDFVNAAFEIESSAGEIFNLENWGSITALNTGGNLGYENNENNVNDNESNGGGEGGKSSNNLDGLVNNTTSTTSTEEDEMNEIVVDSGLNLGLATTSSYSSSSESYDNISISNDEPGLMGEENSEEENTEVEGIEKEESLNDNTTTLPVSVTSEINSSGFFPPTFVVPQGREISLLLKNTTDSVHIFRFNDLSISLAGNGIAPQSERMIVFTTPTSAGSYDFYCDVPGHENERGIMLVE